MKNFLDRVMEWKTPACLLFTGSLMLYTVVTMLFGKNAVDVSIIISLLIFSTLGSLIQYIAFTEHVIKNMKYALRMLIFLIPFAAMLIAVAYIFNWFPMAYPEAWILFIAIFVVVFIGMTIGFEIYYKSAGKKYDGLLGQYRKQRSKENMT